MLRVSSGGSLFFLTTKSNNSIRFLLLVVRVEYFCKNSRLDKNKPTKTLNWIVCLLAFIIGVRWSDSGGNEDSLRTLKVVVCPSFYGMDGLAVHRELCNKCCIGAVISNNVHRFAGWGFQPQQGSLPTRHQTKAGRGSFTTMISAPGTRECCGVVRTVYTAVRAGGANDKQQALIEGKEATGPKRTVGGRGRGDGLKIILVTRVSQSNEIFPFVHTVVVVVCQEHPPCSHTAVVG